MMAAPMTTPLTVPSPPIRLVPPITAAAMASSSYPCPATDCDTPSRAISRMPVSAAENPDSVYARILIREMRTPDSRAASSLPPMAYNWRPQTVWFKSRPISRAKKVMMITGTGISQMEPWPRNMNESEKPEIGQPLVTT